MKKALVTGASGGIGRSFAIKLAQEGYLITAVARNEERLEGLIAELSGNLPEGTDGDLDDGHSYMVADLSTIKGAKLVAKELTEVHYDLLINNAGIGVVGEFHETSLRSLQSMTKLNCDTLVTLSHTFLQKAEIGDALINVSSALAFLPMPSMGLYAATKAFVTSFSESLWYEQKDRGVYVMGLCPGITETAFHKNAGGTEENYPPKSLSQTPEQVVDTALIALKKRKKPTVISGYKNSMFTLFGRMFSRKNLVSMLGKGNVS
jgi:uncharacterized protein